MSTSEGNVTLWVWDAEQQAPIERTLSAADASFANAARIAQQLYRVAPAQGDHRIMRLATALEIAKRQEGYDRPLTASAAPVVTEAAQAGPGNLEQVLDLALDKKLYGAAIAAVDLLGDTQDVSLVQSSDGQPRLLVQGAAESASARSVRGGAGDPEAGSAQHLRGQQSLARGARIPVGQWRSAACLDRRSARGSGSDTGRRISTSWDLMRTPKSEAVRWRCGLSTARITCLRLIGDAIDRPAYRELVQILRNDPRTADMPIGILVRDVNERAARRLAESDALTLAFPPPQTREDVDADTQRMLQVAGRRLVSADERFREASFALDALATLAGDSEKYGFYDLMRLEPRVQQALMIPTLAAKAARVLGLLGTPGAQTSADRIRQRPGSAAGRSAGGGRRVSDGRRSPRSVAHAQSSCRSNTSCTTPVKAWIAEPRTFWQPFSIRSKRRLAKQLPRTKED